MQVEVELDRSREKRRVNKDGEWKKWMDGSREKRDRFCLNKLINLNLMKCELKVEESIQALT